MFVISKACRQNGPDRIIVAQQAVPGLAVGFAESVVAVASHVYIAFAAFAASAVLKPFLMLRERRSTVME